MAWGQVGESQAEQTATMRCGDSMLTASHLARLSLTCVPFPAPGGPSKMARIPSCTSAMASLSCVLGAMSAPLEQLEGTLPKSVRVRPLDTWVKLERKGTQCPTSLCRRSRSHSIRGQSAPSRGAGADWLSLASRHWEDFRGEGWWDIQDCVLVTIDI